MKQFIIDRLEGPWAVVEYGDVVFNFPKEALPDNVKEGDVLRFAVSVDEQATEARKQHIEKLAGELFKDC